MATLFEKAESARRATNLERQAIWFTVDLYLFISAGLLTMHYVHPQHPVGSPSVSPAHTSSGR
ncbi:hypothetical protein OHB12_01765 [Nocardia sp. NBC_01730]|uniref:hypothetical protein n=1 Tax=Nocardia sp. NBC_01730 TaxID=2975998 RepID=UPI002E119223|nr:hypothetical protein OHB12_01765 [Nocardia sp. NBC_01730]